MFATTSKRHRNLICSNLYCLLSFGSISNRINFSLSLYKLKFVNLDDEFSSFFFHLISCSTFSKSNVLGETQITSTGNLSFIEKLSATFCKSSCFFVFSIRHSVYSGSKYIGSLPINLMNSSISVSGIKLMIPDTSDTLIHEMSKSMSSAATNLFKSSR